MRFAYQPILPYHPREQWRWMPLLEVTLMGPQGERRALALVDSGAEYSMVNTQFAELLGIDLRGKPSIDVYGVVGTDARKKTPLAKVGVRIDGVGTTEVEAAFIDSDAVNVILGEINFFDAHKITFVKNRNTFEITAVKKR